MIFFKLASYLPISQIIVLGGVLTSLKTVEISLNPIIQPCNFRHCSTNYVSAYLACGQSQILVYPGWHRLHLHNFKAKSSSNKYSPLSFICFKVAPQNLSTAKRKTRTGNPCPLSGSAAATPRSRNLLIPHSFLFHEMKKKIKLSISPDILRISAPASSFVFLV